MNNEVRGLNLAELDEVSGGVDGYTYCNEPGTHAGLYPTINGCPEGFMTTVANGILAGAAKAAAGKLH